PVIDYDVRAKCADHAYHIFERRVAPDLQGSFRSLRVAEVGRASEVEPDAIGPRGGKQLFGAQDAELRALLGAECILAAFAASDGEQRHVRMQAPRDRKSTRLNSSHQ